jgi:hypothetical protein
MDARPPQADRVLDSSFSLTSTLRSIARDAGYEIDVDDLHAALGLSMFVCAVPAEVDIASWPLYARDAFIVPAGRLFGMTIRELHPPEVALGLSGAAEFRQHFDASYRPLIMRALENNQAVLAWRGWPGLLRLSWGIIKEKSNDGIGLAGVVPALPGAAAPAQSVSLITPPAQLYIVEDIEPRQPDASELLNLALDHTRRVLRGEPVSRFGVLTGADAVRSWIDRITGSRSDGPMNPVLSRGHHELAKSVSAGYQSALRFLERQRTRCDQKYDTLISGVGAMCRQVLTALGESTNYGAVRYLMDDPNRRAKLARQFRNAETAAIDMLAILETHFRTAGSL